MKQMPPKSAERLLLFFLKEDLVEEVLGDLDEKFFDLLQKKSLKKAKLNYWYQVINYLRPFAFKYFRLNSILGTMIKHNFLISYRMLLKNKMFSTINIGGLAIGMTVAILIALWIRDERSFNKNHEHYDRIVQVLRKDRFDGQTYVNSSMVSKLGIYLEETYPTVFENVATTFYRNQQQFLKVGDRSLERLGYFFSRDAAHLLSLEMVAGRRFNDMQPDAILLSRSLAQTLFVGENPVGKNVRFNNSRDLIVSGVYEDLPKNSTFSEMEFIVPIELVYNEDNPATWYNQNTKVYALLNEGVRIMEANNIIKDALSDNIPNEQRITDLLLLPMKDWHLNSTFDDGVRVTSNRVQFIRIYAAIGVFVLILAFINFINLNTARYNNRVKEIGIRKSIGSFRSQLILQFLSESALYSFTSFLISLTISAGCLDWFNELSGKDISMPWTHPIFWAVALIFILFSTIVAGAYPAIFLSSFNPIVALKGSIKQGVLSARFRQGLVVFQFTISIALIIGTITVYNQLQHAKSRPVGYDQSNLITLRGKSEAFFENYDVLRDELKKSGAVVEVASANYPLTNDLGNNDGFALQKTNEVYPITFNTILVTPEYGKATGWEIIAGKDFSRDRVETQNIIISESAAEMMGLKNPLGEVLVPSYNYLGRKRAFTIIGVVKDMIKNSPFARRPKPLMVFANQEALGFVFIRLNPSMDYLRSLPIIEETFNKVLPGYPFNYEFMDDAYQLKFKAEERIGSLATIFSVFAIFISCLGLFGLSAFVVEQRTKEIGIRKVLGASVSNLWNLLSKDFSVLVLIACVIAMPLAAYFLNSWLNTYEYRVAISWWTYIVAGLACLLITLATVSIHSLKSSLSNPVEALRSE
ncbi:MAG: ABC transporter permease [Bacteroidota bacterium]